MFPAESIVRASGVVRDSEGNPIAGAEALLLVGSSRPDRTETDGRFLVNEVVAPGRYPVPLHISAAGFKPLNLSVSTNTNNHVVATLERLGSTEESQASVHALTSEAPAH
jgi:hypothetical protein